MKSLSPGLRHPLQFVVPVSKTVPALYPESEHFRQMPEVFATDRHRAHASGRCGQPSLVVRVDADDGVDVITTGRHERVVIDRDPFVACVGDKVARARRDQAGRPFDRPDEPGGTRRHQPQKAALAC